MLQFAIKVFIVSCLLNDRSGHQFASLELHLLGGSGRTTSHAKFDGRPEQDLLFLAHQRAVQHFTQFTLEGRILHYKVFLIIIRGIHHRDVSGRAGSAIALPYKRLSWRQQRGWERNACRESNYSRVGMCWQWRQCLCVLLIPAGS